MNEAIAIETLCAECASNTTRRAIILCDQCATKFRVIYLPDSVRPWSDIAKDANNDGVDTEELLKGVMVRMFNQQRELSKLNSRIAALTHLHQQLEQRVRGWVGRLRAVMSYVDLSNETPVEDALIDEATRVIKRYQWLRRDNAYAPEEEHVRGGEALDQLCDEGVRQFHGVST